MILLKEKKAIINFAYDEVHELIKIRLRIFFVKKKIYDEVHDEVFKFYRE